MEGVWADAAKPTRFSLIWKIELSHGQTKVKAEAPLMKVLFRYCPVDSAPNIHRATIGYSSFQALNLWATPYPSNSCIKLARVCFGSLQPNCYSKQIDHLEQDIFSFKSALEKYEVSLSWHLGIYFSPLKWLHLIPFEQDNVLSRKSETFGGRYFGTFCSTKALVFNLTHPIKYSYRHVEWQDSLELKPVKALQRAPFSRRRADTGAWCCPPPWACALHSGSHTGIRESSLKEILWLPLHRLRPSGVCILSEWVIVLLCFIDSHCGRFGPCGWTWQMSLGSP